MITELTFEDIVSVARAFAEWAARDVHNQAGKPNSDGYALDKAINNQLCAAVSLLDSVRNSSYTLPTVGCGIAPNPAVQKLAAIFKAQAGATGTSLGLAAWSDRKEANP